MLRKSGIALVAALVILAAVTLFSGVLEQVWPASQSSGLAQKLVEPSKKVDNFPFTTLGKLKNQKQKLAVIDATVGIVNKEYEAKIGLSQGAYDKLVGTMNNPGLFGSAIFALLAGYGVRIYDKNTMYDEREVEIIKNGK